MSTLITAKQCRASRSLLKWNLQDLASRCNIPAKRIDCFEKAIVHLYQNENLEIMDIFKKEGVEFLSDFEVRLRKDAEKKDKIPVFVGTVGLDQNTGDDLQNAPSDVHVATDNYVGPDRRFRADAPPDGTPKRQSDSIFKKPS